MPEYLESVAKVRNNLKKEINIFQTFFADYEVNRIFDAHFNGNNHSLN